MATNRLFLMTYLLLEKGMITAPELAKHFEVSIRTIYRDIDILSAAGIPIYAVQGKGGGITIQDNFVLNKSLITEQEQDQILMALQGIGMIDDENTQPVLSKLSSIFQKQNVNWIEIDFSDWNRESDSNFQALKHSIFQNKIVTFLYYGAEAEPTKRTVEPLKLVFKLKSWYLYAYCCSRKDYRLFKLARIKELCISSQSFSRSAPIPTLTQSNPYQEQIIPITLLFDKKMGYRIYDHFDKVTETEDGHFLVSVSLPQNEWLYSFLLSFGYTVKIISPLSVQKEITTRIDKMQKIYKT